MNFSDEASLISVSDSHYYALSDLGGLLFNGRIHVIGAERLDNWLVLPIHMRYFWGKRLRGELWAMAKYSANINDIQLLLQNLSNKEHGSIETFRGLILARLDL